jgi:hypothetical protein
MRNDYLECILDKPTAWSIHKEFAVSLVEIVNPNIVVELGSEYGFSSFCFAYPKIGHVYGIDWFMDDSPTRDYSDVNHSGNFEFVNRKCLELKYRFGIENVTFIKSEFNEAAKNWDKKIDILHIDGTHTYDAVKNDFETWTKFCDDDSVVLFHDTLSYRDDVGRFFDELVGYKHNIIQEHGLGVYTKSENTFNRIQNIFDKL